MGEKSEHSNEIKMGTDYKKLYNNHVQQLFCTKKRVNDIEMEKSLKLKRIDKNLDDFKRKYNSYLQPKGSQRIRDAKITSGYIPDTTAGQLPYRRRSICLGDINRVTKVAGRVSPVDFPYSFDTWNEMVKSRLSVSPNLEEERSESNIELPKMSRYHTISSIDLISSQMEAQKRRRHTLLPQISFDLEQNKSADRFSTEDLIVLNPKSNDKMCTRRKTLGPNMFSSIPCKFPAIYEAMLKSTTNNACNSKNEKDKFGKSKSESLDSLFVRMNNPKTTADVSLRTMAKHKTGAKKFVYFSKLLGSELTKSASDEKLDALYSELKECRYLRIPMDLEDTRNWYI